MTLDELRSEIDQYSAQASQRMSKLALVGLAIPWFLTSNNLAFGVALWSAVGLLTLALCADYAQYCIATVGLKRIYLKKEAELGRGSEKDFGLRDGPSRKIAVAWFGKHLLLVLGYSALLFHVSWKLIDAGLGD